MMKFRFNPGLFLPLLAVFLPSAAHAHTGIGNASGFAVGLTHPLAGLDHMLAIIAVGIWSSQKGGRSLWAMPAAFVSMMVFGSIIGLAGIELPFIETGIALSVLILGLLITASARLPLAFSIAVISLFAIFHGHAHGAEIPAQASGLSYGAGFVLSTAMLHTAGIAAGILFKKLDKADFARYAGAAIAASGAFMFLA